MTIFKYELMVTDVQAVSMPCGARVLCVQNQNGSMMLWAEVDAHAARVTRTFRVIGTGHDLPVTAALTYVGTVQRPPFVWHVYEETTPTPNDLCDAAIDARAPFDPLTGKAGPVADGQGPVTAFGTLVGGDGSVERPFQISVSGTYDDALADRERACYVARHAHASADEAAKCRALTRAWLTSGDDHSYGGSSR